MTTETKPTDLSKPEEKPFLNVIVHSFFVIPFLIAVFCMLLFAAIHMLTREKRDAADYLADVKTGGITKRWQSAFELSRILSNPRTTPTDENFSIELIKAFKDAGQDDPRVQQYLALAMGRTGNPAYLSALAELLPQSKDENLAAIIYAIGMLKQKDSAEKLFPYITHRDARIRSIAVVALGNLNDSSAAPLLKKALNDSEPNVQWGAAVSLAKLADSSGKEILSKLLNRSYLAGFSEVDSDEQNNLLISAIGAAENLTEDSLTEQIREIAQTDKNMNVRSAAMKYLSK
jgi:HEAT repeat protein